MKHSLLRVMAVAMILLITSISFASAEDATDNGYETIWKDYLSRSCTHRYQLVEYPEDEHQPNWYQAVCQYCDNKRDAISTASPKYMQPIFVESCSHVYYELLEQPKKIVYENISFPVKASGMHQQVAYYDMYCAACGNRVEVFLLLSEEEAHQNVVVADYHGEASGLEAHIVIYRCTLCEQYSHEFKADCGCEKLHNTGTCSEQVPVLISERFAADLPYLWRIALDKSPFS